MKIVVGLGNPGKEYKNTRHNVGFKVVEEIASRYSIEKEESKFDAIIGHIRVGGEKVLLVKPLTYMNLSGKAVQPIMHWYKLDLDDLIVLYDDMDLEAGVLRIRKKGGSGGHNGIASIVDRLASRDFPRLRVGIGRPDNREAVNWVLGKFNSEESETFEIAVKKAADAVEHWIQNGIDEAMNTYN